MIKSNTAREIFYKVPSVKKILWGREFWSDGYFASSVSKHGNENTISKHIKNQGQEYQVLHEDRQVALF
jgi:REP element-mobilizing transposase RayT